jgi:hypothetical protein
VQRAEALQQRRNRLVFVVAVLDQRTGDDHEVGDVGDAHAFTRLVRVQAGSILERFEKTRSSLNG